MRMFLLTRFLGRRRIYPNVLRELSSIRITSCTTSASIAPIFAKSPAARHKNSGSEGGVAHRARHTGDRRMDVGRNR